MGKGINCGFFLIMLNLPVAMILKTFHLLLFMILVPGGLLLQASSESPRVDVPLAGDEVRGVVGIAGSTDVDGFDFSEVFFGFSPDGAWFSLGRQTSPVNNQIIANWDTTNIPDGTYRLLVVVQKVAYAMLPLLSRRVRRGGRHPRPWVRFEPAVAGCRSRTTRWTGYGKVF